MSRIDENRKKLQAKFYPFGFLGTYKYVVVCSRFEGKWLLSRHHMRDTWETQGGHVEDGEAPSDAAKRELYEESGVSEVELYPICDYCGYDDTSSSNGTVFLADIHGLGTLPDSEMREIGLFERLPDELTYPEVTPKLIGRAEFFARMLAI